MSNECTKLKERISIRLKRLRQLSGLTQKQVYEFIGCQPTVYHRMEHGKVSPHIFYLVRLAALYGVTVDYIVSEDKI